MGKVGKMFVVLIGILLIHSAFAFKCTAADAKTIKGEIKIGCSAPLTGPASGWGIGAVNGLEMLADKYNKAGGVTIGDKTYTIKVYAEDNKYETAASVTVTNKLILRDKVDLMTAVGGIPGVAANPLCKRAKMLIMHGGYAKSLISPKWPYSFRNQPTTVQFVLSFLEWYKKNDPDVIKRVASIDPNDGTGQTNVAQWETYCKDFPGSEFVTNEFYVRGSTEFVPILRRILAKNPTLLVSTGGINETGRILKQVREMGFKGVFCIPAPSEAHTLTEIAGIKFAEGALYQSVDLSTPKAQAFLSEYKNKYGEPFLGNSAPFYLTADIWIQAAKKCRSIKAEKIIPVLESSTFGTFWGPNTAYFGGASYYDINHEVVWPVTVVEVHKGKQRLKFTGVFMPKNW